MKERGFFSLAFAARFALALAAVACLSSVASASIVKHDRGHNNSFKDNWGKHDHNSSDQPWPDWAKHDRDDKDQSDPNWTQDGSDDDDDDAADSDHRDEWWRDWAKHDRDGDDDEDDCRPGKDDDLVLLDYPPLEEMQTWPGISESDLRILTRLLDHVTWVDDQTYVDRKYLKKLNKIIARDSRDEEPDLLVNFSLDGSGYEPVVAGECDWRQWWKDAEAVQIAPPVGVPEPATMSLLAVGGAAILIGRRKRN